MQTIPVRFDDITSVENLLCAWWEFLRGKRSRRDVQEFGLHLMDNILALHRDLVCGTYRHGGYGAFNISDPKPRNIHKASVRDRLLHHAVYRVLALHFNQRFIHDSYSCRLGKGTHKALGRFKKFARKESANGTKTCWVLKCDIRKFFASVHHKIQLSVLSKHIADQDTLQLLGRIIESFETAPGKGLPLGNLTSQLLVNVYMNKFDQWMKHAMKVKYYVRYADDFVVLSRDKDFLTELLPKIGVFLEENLKLTLHPDKVFIKTLASGVDFLGWVHFPDHHVLRTATKRRMLKNLSQTGATEATRQSYLGMLRWGNTKKLRQKMLHYTQHAGRYRTTRTISRRHEDVVAFQGAGDAETRP
ncbi:MAG: hypothetical protein AMXMBFR44_0560 [Candidatus Campbellbacteria bacterium]